MTSDAGRHGPLLESIQGIVLAEGFAHLKVGDLARRLRCSKTTLYKIAPSKKELILAVIDRVTDQAYADSLRCIADASITERERLRRWLKNVQVWQDKGSEAFWRDLTAWPPGAELLERKAYRTVLGIRGVIEAGITKGEFRPVNSAYAAYVIALGARATHDSTVLRATGLTSGEAISELAGLVLDGLDQTRERDGRSRRRR
jgi:AcrR family transcriptional regulator